MKKQWLFSAATQSIIIVHLMNYFCGEISCNLHIFFREKTMLKEVDAALWV
jgi:hypothetical protein